MKIKISLNETCSKICKGKLTFHVHKDLKYGGASSPLLLKCSMTYAIRKAQTTPGGIEIE
jgi:hypothetical protein